MKLRAGDFERDGDSGLLLPRGRQRGGPRVHPQYLGPAFFASAPGGGGGGASASAWRIGGFTTPGNTDFSLAELEFWNSGATQMPSFDASLLPFFGRTTDLFDGSTGTRPIWNASDVNTAGFYIHVHFPTARAIDAIKFGGFDNSGRYPTQVSLSYNDTANFATKTLQASASGLTYPGNNTLSAAIDLDGGGTPGAHTDWYVHAMSVSGFLEVSELQFLAGGVVQGNVFAFSHAPSDGTAAQLQDGLLSARVGWPASTAEGSGFYIQWNTGSAVTVNAVKLGAFNDSNTLTTTATLQFFDGSTWQTLGSANGITYPGNNTLSGEITF